MKMNRKVLFAACGLLLVWGMAPMKGYGRTNLVDNPNQVRWKFSPEMDVPHIAWAKPLAGKPVAATIIGPWYAYRDVVELCQRLSLDVTPLMTDGFNQIPMTSQYDCAYPDLGDPPEVWMTLAQEQLRKPADVIVIGKVIWPAFAVNIPAGGWEVNKWPAFSVDLRSRIVEKVKAGSGLLYINPWLEKATNGEVCLYLPTGALPPAEKGKEGRTPALGEKIVLKRVAVADDLGRGMLGLKLPQQEQKDWTDVVYVGALGKGRVMAVDYSYRFGKSRTEEQCRDLTYKPGDSITFAHHCLVGTAQAAELPCAYEYLMSFTARAMLWCAGREPQPGIQKIEVDAAKGISVTVAKKASATKLSVELRDASGDIGQVIKQWDSAEGALPLPALKGGTYFVNAWLKNNKGEVLDWGSARLDMPAAGTEEKRLTAITTRAVAPKPGMPVAGEIAVASPWTAGDVLRLSVMDNFNRCLWRSEWTTPGASVPFRATFNPGRSVAAVLKAERLRGETVVESLEKTICFSTMELDGDFVSVLWTGTLNNGDRTSLQDMALCRRLGIDALMHIPPELREACVRSNMRLAHYVLRVVPEQVRGFSDPRNIEWWRHWFRSAAKELAPYAPLTMTFGDETCGSPPACDMTPPYGDQDFRLYLGWMCDPANGHLNLTALNKAWGTKFKTAEEITVLPLETLRTNNVPAQWVTESLWAQWRYQRLLRESTEAAWHEIPTAYYGDEGVANNIYNGWQDFYLLHKDMTMCQMYDSTGCCGQYFIKSFAAPRSLRGMWTGNYEYFAGAVDEEWMRSRPWRSLFSGMNSEWWWMLCLSVRPDGKPIPAFAQWCEEINRIKAGPATLLLKAAQPSVPQVAVLYSPNTLHAHVFKHGDAGPHSKSLTVACQGMARTGYALKVLHPTQLDDSRELGAGYKALVLPAILTLSTQQVATIRRFVEQGGVLIADQAPEQYLNEFGVPYEKDPFRSVFTKGAGENEYTFGKGKAILLKEAFSLNLLEWYKDVQGQTYSEKQNKPLVHIFRDWIESSTACKPPVSISLPDGSLLADGEISTFEDGPALYVGIDRSGRYWEGEQCRWLTWNWYQEEVAATLTFDRPGYVYDVTHGEYVGEGPVVKVKLTSLPRLFAVLPSKVEQLAVEGLAQSYRPGETVRAAMTIKRNREAACLSVVHVSVRKAGGEVLPWFERNLIVSGNQGTLALPLAQDEAPGSYQMVFRDVATAVTQTVAFDIR